MKNWTDDELPRATSDLEALKTDMDEFGYCIVASSLELPAANLLASVNTRNKIFLVKFVDYGCADRSYCCEQLFLPDYMLFPDSLSFSRSHHVEPQKVSYAGAADRAEVA